MKAAIYCRLSSEDRDKKCETDDSNSIQNQKSMLLEYSIEKGWEIYGIYSDDDYAGTDRKRPEFNRLLRDAEAHKFDIVLCKSQSRFTRELELVEKYINTLFPVWGIRFISIVDNADTAVKSNAKSRQINGLINEWYLSDLSENIKSVLVNKRQQGLFTGSQPLYGYKKDPEKKGHLIIDEEAADVVREVFTLFAGGMGKANIARLLNQRGIPNPTEYKRLHGQHHKPAKSKFSTLWKYFAISDMLINEMYLGNMVQGKYGSISYKTKQNKPKPKNEWVIVKGTHEPIIDRELWDKVQELIKQKAKPFTNSGKVGVFSKKVKCAECGYYLRTSKPGGSHGERRYFVCTNHFVDKHSCNGACIADDRLERYVLAELKSLSNKHLDMDELERKAQFDDGLNKQRIKALSNVSSYNKRIADCSKGVKDLYLDKVKGIVTEDMFIELSKELYREKADLEALLQDENEKLDSIEARIKAGDNRRELIQRYVNADHLTREMTDALIDYIDVGRRIHGTHEVPIVIHWKF